MLQENPDLIGDELKQKSHPPLEVARRRPRNLLRGGCHFRKLIPVLIILFFCLIPKKSLAAENLPSQKDLKGTEILLLYLKVNPQKKLISLDKIEAKYGFTTENNSPTEQVVEVVKDNQILFTTPFQIEELAKKDNIFFSGEDPFKEITDQGMQEREELIVVPYIKDSQVLFRDRQGEKKTYFIIESQTIESFRPGSLLKKDYQEKKEKIISGQEEKVVVYQGETQKGTTVNSINLLKQKASEKKLKEKEEKWFWLTNFLQFLKKLWENFLGKIISLKNSGKVKGLTSPAGREIHVAYVFGPSTGFDSQAQAESLINRRHQRLFQRPPFNEFSSKIKSYLVFTNEDLVVKDNRGYNLTCYGACPTNPSCEKGSGNDNHQYGFNQTKARSAAASVPGINAIFVVYNWRGRSNSYNLSVCDNRDTFVHELGHAFAGLFDEYLYSINPAPAGRLPAVNCSAMDGRSCVKWQNHACYKECTYPNWGRFSFGCMMRDGVSDFCDACKNHIRSVFNGGPINPEENLTFSCKTLLIKIINALGSSCGSPDFDKEADLEKNGFVNGNDYLNLFFFMSNNPTRCQQFLDDTTDPCNISGTLTPTPTPTPTTNPLITPTLTLTPPPNLTLTPTPTRRKCDTSDIARGYDFAMCSADGTNSPEHSCGQASDLERKGLCYYNLHVVTNADCPFDKPYCRYYNRRSCADNTGYCNLNICTNSGCNLLTITPTATTTPVPSLSCTGGCYGSSANCQTNCGRPCTTLEGANVENMCGWPSYYKAYRCCSGLIQASPTPASRVSPTVGPRVTLTPTPTVAGSLSCSGACYGSSSNCQTNCGRPCMILDNTNVQNMCGWPAGYKAYRCCTGQSVSMPTQIPIITLGYTPSYNSWCDSGSIYDTNWRKITNLNSLQAGQKVYLAVSGLTTHPKGITKARFRVNGLAGNWCQEQVENNWCVTSRRKGSEYFVIYTFQAAGRYLIQSMVYTPDLGWR